MLFIYSNRCNIECMLPYHFHHYRYHVNAQTQAIEINAVTISIYMLIKSLLLLLCVVATRLWKTVIKNYAVFLKLFCSCLTEHWKYLNKFLYACIHFNNYQNKQDLYRNKKKLRGMREKIFLAYDADVQRCC